MKRSRLPVAILASLLLSAPLAGLGCGSSDSAGPPGQGSDGGPLPDGSMPPPGSDSSVADGTPTDSRATDTGTGDARVTDSGAGDGPAVDAPTGDGAPGTVHHYEYVLPPSGSVDVYDLDNGFNLLKSIPVPQLMGVGSNLSAVASSVTGMLYVSSGTQGGGTGHVLKYDLVHDSVVWAQSYSFDVDSAAITPDGLTLFQATGAMSPQGVWQILDATSGSVKGTIDSGGTGPHDTIVTLDGTKVFLGPRHSNYLVLADIATNTILQRIGPVASGVRPFTINGKASIVFINTAGLIGFYVADVSTGAILFTVSPPGFPTVGACGGSHGVSLSPDERELYLVDCSYNRVHVFDVTGLPGTAPTDVADIQLQTNMTGEGWIQHTRDGRFAIIGASGDVIDTTTRAVVGNLASLQTGQIFNEVDFQNGVPVFSPLSRNQGGYVP
jgi:DNA-binding beta-propeller fold protein YncE